MYSYPIFLLVFLVLPLVALWAYQFRVLRKYTGLLVLVSIGCLAISIPWDILSVNDGIWHFTVPHIVGLHVLGLPIEEYFYIVTVGLLASSTTIVLWEKFGTRA